MVRSQNIYLIIVGSRHQWSDNSFQGLCTPASSPQWLTAKLTNIVLKSNFPTDNGVLELDMVISFLIAVKVTNQKENEMVLVVDYKQVDAF